MNRVYEEAATALSVAVDYKRYDVVKQLLAARADPNLIGSKKLNPLKACVVNDDVLGTFMLLQSGAGRVDRGTLDVIQAAAIKNHLELLHLLLAMECNVNGVLQMWKEGTIFYFIQDEDTLEFIVRMSRSPRKLQMLCRHTIRSTLALPVLQHIDNLPTPKKLREYLKYADVEKAWFKS